MVNVYLLTNCKAPKQKQAYGIYMLEYTSPGKKPVRIVGGLELQDATRNFMELKTLNAALKRFTKNSEICIFTLSKWLSRVLMDWLHEWQYNGYRSKKGGLIQNANIIAELAKLTNPHKYSIKNDFGDVLPVMQDLMKTVTENGGFSHINLTEKLKN